MVFYLLPLLIDNDPNYSIYIYILLVLHIVNIIFIGLKEHHIKLSFLIGLMKYRGSNCNNLKQPLLKIYSFLKKDGAK